MLRVFVEEAAALASIGLFVGMIAIWAQLIPQFCRSFEAAGLPEQPADSGPLAAPGEKPDSGRRGVRAAWTRVVGSRHHGGSESL